MQILILGPGRLGRAIATESEAAGWATTVVGRPAGGAHPAGSLAPADVAIDASRGEAVVANLEAVLAAGTRRVVLASTGWEDDLPRVRELLLDHGASAVVAPNLSLGAAFFLRLAEVAAGWYARADGFEPFVVEWHRSGKADRPSGTARTIAQRIAAADGRWTAPGADTGTGARPLEVVSVRAGSSPGMHVVGFDAPGETIELHLTARDRSAYAAGAVATVRWLVREPRDPGLHSFDAVVDDLLAAPTTQATSVPA
jgi:4-hydroxy-tetrahydrodipicolinate reductase